ncbi:MAG: ABC transporter substrate-binding protein [Pseudolabrys sp.]
MILRALAVLACSLALAASFWMPAGAQERSADRILVGTQLSAANAPLFVAMGKKFFEEERLTVEVRSFKSADQLLKVLAEGRIDFATLEFSAAAFDLAGKGAIRLIAAQAREHKDFEGNDVVASIKAHARGLVKVKDLAGRTVAVTKFGSTYHYQLGQIARANGFDLQKITLKQLQSLEEVSEAINNDRVDAAVLPVHYARALLMASQARLVGWCSETDETQLGGLFVSAKAVAAKRPQIEKFLNAYRRGASEFTGATMRRDRFAKRIFDARSRTIATLVGRYVYPQLPADRAMAAIETTAYYVDPQAKIDLPDIVRQVEWFKAQGLVAADVDPKSIVDLSFTN